MKSLFAFNKLPFKNKKHFAVIFSNKFRLWTRLDPQAARFWPTSLMFDTCKF